jgi:hypothetical protein
MIEKYDNKLRTYRKFKSSLNVSSYVKDVLNRQHRRISSILEVADKPFAVETGRYNKPKMSLNERKCVFCKENFVEDEIHFLLDCDFYSDLLYGLTGYFCISFENFMSNEEIQPYFLAKTLYNMF